MRDEEQDAYDNTPESLQEGERGQKMNDAIDAIEDARQSAESAADELDRAASE